MRSVPAGSFDRLSSLESLWHAWLDCRRGKRHQPRLAAFDIDADTQVVHLHRTLRDGSYRPASGYPLKPRHVDIALDFRIQATS